MAHAGSFFCISPCRSYPLHKAAYSNRTDCLAALLKSGASVDCQDFHDGTPLHNAAFGGHVECIEVRLNQSRMHHCCLVADGFIVWLGQILLEHGANPNCVDDQGVSPLHLAISSGHFQCAKQLLEKGADINLRVLAHQVLLQVFPSPRLTSPLLAGL